MVDHKTKNGNVDKVSPPMLIASLDKATRKHKTRPWLEFKASTWKDVCTRIDEL